MSASGQTFTSIFSVPVSLFAYPQTDADLTSLPAVEPVGAEDAQSRPSVILTEEALSNRLALARAEAIHQTEARLRQDYEVRLALEAEKVAAALRDFDTARQVYFSRVEMEIVQLALSIAGKILHREAQVDPMLVAALVRIALGQLKDGSSVSIRVRPEEVERWRDHFQVSVQSLNISVTPDAELAKGGCVLETELGSADFALDAQLKEVEQGFFDVLAQRP
jgi:flagellar assembly protein FliH